MRNVYNCNNCLYSINCEIEDVKAEQGCFEHSDLDLKYGKITEAQYSELWDAKFGDHQK